MACGTNTCSSPSPPPDALDGEIRALAGDVEHAFAAARTDLDDLCLHKRDTLGAWRPASRPAVRGAPESQARRPARRGQPGRPGDRGAHRAVDGQPRHAPPSRRWTSGCRGSGPCRRRTARGSGWSRRPGSPRSWTGSATPNGTAPRSRARCSAPRRASWPGRSACSRRWRWCVSSSTWWRRRSTSWRRRAASRSCARPCSGTPGRSPSARRRSTRGPRRRGERGTPGWRPSSSIRWSGARPRSRCARGHPR